MASILTKVAAAALLACTAACADETFLAQAPMQTPITIHAAIDQTYSSRADDDGFAQGDRMGIYIVDYKAGAPAALAANGNHADNVSFRLSESAWRPVAPIYWTDKTTPVDVYGYYPYQSQINNVDACPLQVASDQTPSDDGSMSGYERSDFLWAKAEAVAPTSETIRLRYTHRMAGLLVALAPGDGISDTEWAKVTKTVTVDNTVRSATVDLATGIVSPVGAPEGYIIMAPQGDDSYRAVTVPQTIADGTRLLSITIDGTSYAYTRTQPLKLQSGKLHRFTLRIDKKEGGEYSVALVAEDINPWENDLLTHNFLQSQYTIVTTTEPGTLRDAIEALGKDYTKVKNLKIVGPITNDDFFFMRDQMDALTMLNLKDVRLRNIEFSHWDGDLWETVYEYYDDVIPESAMAGKRSLRRLVLPDSCVRIGSSAFREIGLDVNSTLIMPAALKEIDGEAFYHNEEAGELVLNDGLEKIGDHAFAWSSFSFDFYLPESLKYLGNEAFAEINYVRNRVRGHFHIPEGLEYWGHGAFVGLSFDEVGEVVLPDYMTELTDGTIPGFSKGIYLTLPKGLKKLHPNSLSGQRFLNHIKFPESLTTICREAAHWGTDFTAGVTFPSSLRIMERSAFIGCAGIGDLELPEGIVTIPPLCFGNGAGVTSCVLPNSCVAIDEEAFQGAPLRSITIDKYCTQIGRRAFFQCGELRTVVCLNPEPPTMAYTDQDNYPFCWCDLDHLVLEVPAGSVDLYRNTPGWSHIRFITEHHELAVNIPQLKCLDRGIEYEGMVRAEGPWVLEDCPDWCHVTPTSGTDRRTEIKITVDPATVGTDREGQIVFRLRDNAYTTTTDVHQYGYEYAEDQEIVLQQASKGPGIPVLIVADAYDAPGIARGDYMRAMQDAYEHLFDIEPYKTYRDYFTVSTAIACSPDEGPHIDASSKPHVTRFGFGIGLFGPYIDFRKIHDYAMDISEAVRSNPAAALVITATNYDAFCGGTDTYRDDLSMAWCARCSDTFPYDYRGLVQHYAGGLAFGKLAPEYVTHYEFFKACSCGSCQQLPEYKAAVAKGWYQNVALTSSMNAVPWAHLIFDLRYSDIVDVYEGAYRHLRGAYRSENQSCMSTYINYYNTISREQIVRRIKALAGESFDFEDFVAHDSRAGLPE